MGCMFSSSDSDGGGDDDDDSEASDTVLRDSSGGGGENDTSAAGGVMIKAVQAAASKHANVSSDGDTANDSQNAKRQQQHQQSIAPTLMTINAAPSLSSARLGGQQRKPASVVEKQTSLTSQSFSLSSLLAHGRRVIQSAVKVSAIDSVDRSAPLTAQAAAIICGNYLHSPSANNNSSGNGTSRRESREASREIEQREERGQRRKANSATDGRQAQRAKMMASDQQEAAATREEFDSASSIVTTSHESNVTTSDRRLAEDRTNAGCFIDDVILFTSIRQLCTKIVKDTIVRDARSANHRAAARGAAQPPAPGSAHHTSDKPHCVFLFGAQGSCKGELAFELVQHSPLLRTISAANRRRRETEPEELECPLYHHIDVAALIIANIDERIREYVQLQLQAIHNKQLEERHVLRPLASSGSGGGLGGDSIGSGSQESEANCELLLAEEGDEQQSYVASDMSESSTSSYKLDYSIQQQRMAADEDDFVLVTLSTKQRSVLELKLIKYSNCVTTKWIMGLIEAEVDRLEARNRQQVATAGQSYDRRVRVYLINLVPNQLSLFKCCLYLHQQELLRLKDFKYWSAALKFERRTNIRVMTKERAVNKKPASSERSSIRTTIASSLGRSQRKQQQQQRPSSGSPSVKGVTVGAQDKQAEDKDLAVIATDALLGGLNEKLGPKLNETFVEQFRSARRLYRARYNRGAPDSSCDDDDDDDLLRCCSPMAATNQQLDTSDEVARLGEPCRVEIEGMRLSPPDRTRELSGSMQNLLIVSPDATPAETDPSLLNPRLSLCVSPTPLTGSPSSGQQLSPSSLQLLSSSSSANNSLASASLLTTSGESLSSIGARSAKLDGGELRITELQRAIEVHLIDSATYHDYHRAAAAASTLAPSPNFNEPEMTKLTRWRHGHFRNNSLVGEHLWHQAAGRPIAYYPEPRRRGFSPLVHKVTTTTTTGNDSVSGANLVAPASNRHHHCYQLVSSTVHQTNTKRNSDMSAASLTEGGEEIFEVKRLHSRIVKLKSGSDLEKLTKLIKKARRQLELDTRRWLAEAIIFNSYRLIGDLSAEQRPAVAATSRLRAPQRIVYMFCLDVRRLKSGHFQAPDSIDMSTYLGRLSAFVDDDKAPSVNPSRGGSSIKSILKPQPCAEARRRPVSAQPEAGRTQAVPFGESCGRRADCNRLGVGESSRGRPASSLAADGLEVRGVAPARRPRHVQFRLARSSRRQMAEAPPPSRRQPESHLQPADRHCGDHRRNNHHSLETTGERRLWLSENLFVSAPIGEDISLLDAAAALIRIYLKSAGSEQPLKANKL